VAATLLGVAYVALNIYSYTQLGFSHQTQAFGSVFFVLAVYQMLTATIGISINAVALWSFLRRSEPDGEESPSRYQSVPEIALFWYYAVVAGVFTYALLYVVPYFI
jgi:cytochrome c oxidase subunit III